MGQEFFSLEMDKQCSNSTGFLKDNHSVLIMAALFPLSHLNMPLLFPSYCLS